MDSDINIQAVLEEAVKLSRQSTAGSVASYIPELENMSEEVTNVAVTLCDGTVYVVGDDVEQKFTLQSAAKLVPLIGLLEELGPEELFRWVRVEPSGDDFASVARLDQFGPTASNPMLNSGAITLCGLIPGSAESKLHWLDQWMEKLFGEKLYINATVCASERRTGDRNRSLAYLLKTNGILKAPVDQVLETYFSLCSFEATVKQASHLSMLLANGGKSIAGEQVISRQTASQVVAIMATCGLYNESGTHLVRTGLPAKSSVSGFIIAVAPRHAGVAVINPRVDRKGTSLRGEIMLEYISKRFDWHFAG